MAIFENRDHHFLRQFFWKFHDSSASASDSWWHYDYGWRNTKLSKFMEKLNLTTVSSSLPCIGQISSDGNIMDPRLESSVEKLLPVRPNLKHQWATEKQMFVAETSGYTTEIKQIPAQQNQTCQYYGPLTATTTITITICLQTTFCVTTGNVRTVLDNS